MLWAQPIGGRKLLALYFSVTLAPPSYLREIFSNRADMKRDFSALVKAPALVSTAWLSSQLSAVKVVDASWYLPAMKRDPRAEYESCRIPGATFFDVDATDDKSSLPHMIPSEYAHSLSVRVCLCLPATPLSPVESRDSIY